jgi:hypothetical protein
MWNNKSPSFGASKKCKNRWLGTDLIIIIRIIQYA